MEERDDGDSADNDEVFMSLHYCVCLHLSPCICPSYYRYCKYGDDEVGHDGAWFRGECAICGALCCKAGIDLSWILYLPSDLNLLLLPLPPPLGPLFLTRDDLPPAVVAVRALSQAARPLDRLHSEVLLSLSLLLMSFACPSRP